MEGQMCSPPCCPQPFYCSGRIYGGPGGADDTAAYSCPLTKDQKSGKKIIVLEALNILVGLHTLLRPSDVNTHMVVYCDNFAAVQAMESGRAKDPTLMRCARALWMLQAHLNLRLTYIFVPGASNNLPDALSRECFSPHSGRVADRLISQRALVRVRPCMFVFDDNEFQAC